MMRVFVLLFLLLFLLLSLAGCTSMLVGGATTPNASKKCQENPRAEGCSGQLRPQYND